MSYLRTTFFWCLLYLIISCEIVKSIEIIKSFGSLKLTNFVILGEGQVLQKNESVLSRKWASNEEECWFLCLEDVQCLSVNAILQSSSSCLCELFNWTAFNVSSHLLPKKNSSHSAIKGVCFNGGSCLQLAAGVCHCACPGGYYGSFCEKGPFKDCAAIQSAGFTSSGVYQVKPDDKGAIHVYCDMISEGGGWTVISNRFNGSTNFNRDWTQYKTGFGDINNGEFWLGNDNIHRLTAARPRTQLYVPLVNMAGSKFYAKYSTFAVASESDLYRLTVTGYYAGNAGDSFVHNEALWRSHNMVFSTPERDNDKCPCNCAAGSACGWWMNWCGAARMTQYPMQWHALRPSYQMKEGSMKIKPYI